MRLFVTTFVVAVALLCPASPGAQFSAAGHRDHPGMAGLPRDSAVPMQAGQAAFAAIEEIVALLEADP